MRSLQVKLYRFSVSWARLLPSGRGDVPNPAGLAYYKSLIADLLSAGITPFVTIFHWDLPQALEDEGGWLSEDIAEAFGDYARICYREFGRWVQISCPSVLV